MYELTLEFYINGIFNDSDIQSFLSVGWITEEEYENIKSHRIILEDNTE